MSSTTIPEGSGSTYQVPPQYNSSESEGSGDERGQIQTQDGSQAAVTPLSGKSSKAANALWWSGVAFAVSTLVIATFFTLAYFGQLQVAWAGAGALSPTMALYGAISGVGLTTIATVFLAIKGGLDHSRAKAQQAAEHATAII